MSLALKDKGNEGDPFLQLALRHESQIPPWDERYANRNIHKALMIRHEKESLVQFLAGAILVLETYATIGANQVEDLSD